MSYQMVLFLRPLNALVPEQILDLTIFFFSKVALYTGKCLDPS